MAIFFSNVSKKTPEGNLHYTGSETEIGRGQILRLQLSLGQPFAGRLPWWGYQWYWQQASDHPVGFQERQFCTGSCRTGVQNRGERIPSFWKHCTGIEVLCKNSLITVSQNTAQILSSHFFHFWDKWIMAMEIAKTTWDKPCQTGHSFPLQRFEHQQCCSMFASRVPSSTPKGFLSWTSQFSSLHQFSGVHAESALLTTKLTCQKSSSAHNHQRTSPQRPRVLDLICRTPFEECPTPAQQ